MKNLNPALLLLTLMLGACSPIIPATEAIPISPAPKIVTTVSTPHIDQPPDGNIPTVTPTDSSCGYKWAYQDLPDLSSEFQQAIQELQPNAQASAYAFGEDCIYADGHKTFTAMETDFNITLQVNDPTNEDELGDWIVKVMQAVLNIPKEKIAGPRPGRVSIIFQTGAQNQPINFYIDQYQRLPSGLTHTEIYQSLKTPQ